MFNSLADRLNSSLKKLRGIGRLTDDNIKNSLKDVRKALLDADVALSVVKQFVADIRKKALGQEITRKIRPGDAFIKLVQDEITEMLGEKNAALDLNAQKPVVILMAGLQGSGKTTSTAKLAKWLKQSQKKNVLMVSTDIYRPAAIDQLKTLAEQIEVDFFPSSPEQPVLDIARQALNKAKTAHYDALLIDTAGRLHIDDAMMRELSELSQQISPTETLLVVDSMAGQDAVNMAKTFNEQLELTGIILTKIDGDARGGAALSMRMVTGKPIKFMGSGEKVDALEPFHPERVASRILGMGDIVSLVEQAEQSIDKAEAEKLAKKIHKGKRFTFNDFLAQLRQMKKMGGVQSLLSKLPNMGQLPANAASMVDDKMFVRMEAIIQSMTPRERSYPDLLNGSRKRRIACGSGTSIQDVNRLLKQYNQMQKMMKQLKGNKFAKQMQNFDGMLPPDLKDKFLPPDK